MSVTYSTAVKNARLDAVTTLIDAGVAGGKIKIGTTGMGTVLATITLSDPAASAASGGVLTFSGFPISDTSADASGTAAAAIVTDSNDVTIISGLTVGTSATDIIIDNVVIAAGQTVTVTAMSITHS